MTSPADLLAWLDWYRAMGAADWLGDRPVDRCQAGVPAADAGPRPDIWSPAAMASTPAPMPAPGRPAARPAPPPLRSAGSVASSARAIAAACQSVDEIEAALRTFDGCPLKETATPSLLRRRQPGGRLMLIGEAPGAEEDRQGKPFVGPSGQLLDRMLATIGLDRARVYITNSIFWRPPGNRTPTPAEIAVCQPFLERQIELIPPELISVLGGSAARALLGVSDGVTKLRGRRLPLPAGRRQPAPGHGHVPPGLSAAPAAHKRLVWRDLLAIQELLIRLNQSG